jgi:hypothetical protein
MSGEYMPNRLTLAQQWTSFELMTGVVKTSGIQRHEMRRAFYAGAAALMDAMMIGLSADAEPTEADMQYMDSIADELRQFAENVSIGRA